MSQGFFSISRPCPRCLGTGEIRGKPCSQCNGSGKTKSKKTVVVKIPAGSEDGKKIRLRGMGNVGQNGGEYGDLIITLRVKPDPFFTRQGDDLYCTIPLTLKQAVEGLKVKVRTLNGQALLKIPPLSGDGSLFRLKGQGIRQGDKVGDQYVRVHIKYPAEPTAEEKELIARLEKQNDKMKA